jgi:hypothetical protein
MRMGTPRLSIQPEIIRGFGPRSAWITGFGSEELLHGTLQNDRDLNQGCRFISYEI